MCKKIINTFPDGGESPVTIATSIPVKQFLAGGHGNHVHVQGHVLPPHVNPYDLIKKYVAESSPPNSLSDSHLSSDGGGDGKEKRNGGDGGDFLIGSESEEFTESDDGGDDRVATKAAAAGLGDRCVVARFNSFRISGQKIQIYSDCSADNGRSGNYSLSSSSSSSERDGDEEDNDADADDDDDDDDDEDDGLEDRDSCYDADVSLTESPRVSKFPPPPLPPPFPPAVDLAPPPCKPPRRKSSEKELRPALQRPAAPNLQLRIVDLSPPPGATSTPQRRTSTLPRPSSSRLSGDSHKLQLSRQTSSESSSQQQRRGSLTSRSRSFAGGGSASSRESLLLFGISQNFSSEVMKELYGSKTSLLQHLDQEQRRKQRLSDPTAAASGVVSLVDGDARAVPVLVPTAAAAAAAAAGSDLEVSERTGTSQFLFFIQNIFYNVEASFLHHTKPSPPSSPLVAVNKSAES